MCVIRGVNYIRNINNIETNQAFRFRRFSVFYPYTFPIFILALNGSLSILQIKNEAQVFCLINPESDVSYFKAGSDFYALDKLFNMKNN